VRNLVLANLLVVFFALVVIVFTDPGIESYPAAQCGTDSECMELCPVDDLTCDGGPELEP